MRLSGQGPKQQQQHHHHHQQQQHQRVIGIVIVLCEATACMLPVSLVSYLPRCLVRSVVGTGVLFALPSFVLFPKRGYLSTTITNRVMCYWCLALLVWSVRVCASVLAVLTGKYGTLLTVIALDLLTEWLVRARHRMLLAEYLVSSDACAMLGAARRIVSRACTYTLARARTHAHTHAHT
jgi:hypothetical protein